MIVASRQGHHTYVARGVEIPLTHYDGHEQNLFPVTVRRSVEQHGMCTMRINTDVLAE
jgi:hypothetical protein